jgi:glycosyltransferase involved in cell wall biosynthesis
MRALILADGSFASRERALLSRLEVGLADEGVRVVRVTPIEPAAESLDNPYLRWIRFPEPSAQLFSPISARAVLQDITTMREMSVQDNEPIDLVHIMGDNAWSSGERIARELDAAVVYELWSEVAVQRGLALARSLKSRDEEQRRRVIFLCPDEGVEQRIEANTPWVNRRLAVWGVHSQNDRPDWPKRESAFSVLMLGVGDDIAACKAALDGLSRLRTMTPTLLIFLDAALVRSSNALWKHAERLKLLDCLSVIEDTESRRELSLQVDAVVVPERLQEHRTILLDAMAHGVLVLAREGCPMTALRPNETAIVIERGDADEWERSVAQLLSDRARAAALLEGAIRFVREHRLASAHVRGALNAYETVAGAPPIAFAAGARVG